MGKNKSLKSDTYLLLMRETLFEETIPALSTQNYLQEPLAFHLLIYFFFYFLISFRENGKASATRDLGFSFNQQLTES